VENERLYGEAERLLGQVRSMQRQRDLFFAMINHELRNSLTGRYGWAGRLVRRKSPEHAERAAREVYEAADHTIVLLNNFLDLMRLDAGKVRPVIREVDVGAAVQRAFSSSEPAASAKRLQLVARADGAPEAVRTDPVRLEQILLNLLSNAIRHSPEGVAVETVVGAAKGQTTFSAIDHGPVVPVELRERIFEPIQRFDPHLGLATG